MPTAQTTSAHQTPPARQAAPRTRPTKPPMKAQIATQTNPCPRTQFTTPLALLALLLAALLSPTTAQAATLQEITFKPASQDRLEITLNLDSSDYPRPLIFVSDNPARLVLDLPGVANQVTQKKFPLAAATASEAILLGTPERIRLTLNLEQPTVHELLPEGNQLRLLLSPAATAPPSQIAAAPATTTTPAPTTGQPNTVAPRILNLDFRRGEAGEGNLIFELADDSLNADVAVQGSTIRIHFPAAQLAESIARSFDALDFATPVTYFSTRNQGNRAIVEIQTNAPFDYLAYQTDTSYVVSIKPTASGPDAPGEFSYVGEKLSLNFQNIAVRSVLQLIADFTDMNLVASDAVTGNITLRLQNVPWDQALDIVLKVKGLGQRREGNVLLVAPLAEIAERERLEGETNKQLRELAPLTTEYVRVRYADAASLFALVGGGASGGRGGGDNTVNLLSERGSAIVDPRTNTIVLNDTEENIARFKELVDELDIPIRQVLIEARIVLASDEFRRELGVRWGGTGVNISDSDDRVVQFGPTINDVDGDAANIFRNRTATIADDTLAVDLGVTNQAASRFAVSFLTDSSFLSLELSALESEGLGEVISQPKVLTGDKQTAFIKSGSEVAFQNAASSGATATEFKEAVLELQVTPQITPDDKLILDLLVRRDSIGDREFGGEPEIDTTELQTQVLVDNGETLVLGGIFQLDSRNNETKVPFLGDLPLIGRAFKRTLIEDRKNELLIFVTPKILSENVQAQ